MKKILLVGLALTLAATAWAGTAFFQYEQKCTGFKKICVYDYNGEEYAITIDCYKFCPYTINVD
jgi:hypothetical protein